MVYASNSATAADDGSRRERPVWDPTAAVRGDR